MSNVLDFGAAGDGSHKDTEAIQRALDAGGLVYFPPGVYLTGTLFLRSHSGIHLETGAVLLGSPDPEDYNSPDFCLQNSVCKPEKAYGGHLIVGLEVQDIFIRGQGVIDGNRKAFFDPAQCSRDQFQGWRPSQMIFLCESSDILLEGVILQNSPYWACFLFGCENARVEGLKILNRKGVWNGDGLDIDCCRQVCVSDCVINTSDDSLTVRASGANRLQNAPVICENVVVSNCMLTSGQAGVRVGVGAGIIRHCLFNNLTIGVSS